MIRDWICSYTCLQTERRGQIGSSREAGMTCVHRQLLFFLLHGGLPGRTRLLSTSPLERTRRIPSRFFCWRYRAPLSSNSAHFSGVAEAVFAHYSLSPASLTREPILQKKWLPTSEGRMHPGTQKPLWASTSLPVAPSTKTTQAAPAGSKPSQPGRRPQPGACALRKTNGNPSPARRYPP